MDDYHGRMTEVKQTLELGLHPSYKVLIIWGIASCRNVEGFHTTLIFTLDANIGNKNKCWHSTGQFFCVAEKYISYLTNLKPNSGARVLSFLLCSPIFGAL